MTAPALPRRALLLALTAAALAACSSFAPPRDGGPPPVVFVHGNGDSAALWTTTVWRFESNGWPRDRLHALDVPYPQSRDLDDKPQPGRSSTAEHRSFLAAEVERVLKATWRAPAPTSQHSTTRAARASRSRPDRSLSLIHI